MSGKSYTSMHKKLIKMLTFCLLVPMLLYCLYSYQFTRGSLGRKYQQQTISTMQATAQAISSYMSIADHTARSLHYNQDILEVLALNGQNISPSRQRSITSQLFRYMQQLYGVVPDATQIHIDAYRLRRILLLTDTFQQYEKEHIYLQSERTVSTLPYETYVLPTHMQYDYNFTNTELDTYSLVVTLVLPLYRTPSDSELIGKLSIDIPIEVLGQMCAGLYDSQETFYLLDSQQNILFSSDPELTATAARSSKLRRLCSQAAQTSGMVIDRSDSQWYFCAPISEAPLDWYMVKSTPASYVYRDADQFFRHSLAVLMLSILAALTCSFFIIVRQTRPLRQLTRYTDAIQKGKLDEHLSDYIVYTENDEIGRLIHSIQKMMYSINHFIIREYQLNLANKSSELKALQAQINPHFIYNTLQCIAAESLETNNLELYRSITTLGQMMQYSMDTRHNRVELQQEIQNCANYVRLQKMRFAGSDVSLELDNEPDTLHCVVPKMILQPLVENAFKHGNLLKIPGGRIWIRSSEKDGILHIFVEDNGTGISFERLEQVQEQLRSTKEALANRGVQNFLELFAESEQKDEERKADAARNLKEDLKEARENLHASSSSIGLSNVYMRLLLMYSHQCQMSIYPNEDSGTTIHIEIMRNSMNQQTEDEAESRKGDTL